MIYEITKDEEIRSMNYANLGCIPNVTQQSTLDEIIANMQNHSTVTTWINQSTYYPNLYNEIKEKISAICGITNIYGNLTIDKGDVATTIILTVRSMSEYTFICSYSTTSTGWGEWRKILTDGAIKSTAVSKSGTVTGNSLLEYHVSHGLSNIIPLGITAATVSGGDPNGGTVDMSKLCDIDSVAVTTTNVHFRIKNRHTSTVSVTGTVIFSYIQL